MKVPTIPNDRKGTMTRTVVITLPLRGVLLWLHNFSRVGVFLMTRAKQLLGLNIDIN